MKTLIVGSNGQLGWELRQTCPESVQMTAIDYPDVDITQKESVRGVLDIHAQWPAFSLMGKHHFCEVLGFTPPHWRKQLCRMIQEFS
jgi:dTDP-4-dehydrorhamnose reductase